VEQRSRNGTSRLDLVQAYELLPTASRPFQATVFETHEAPRRAGSMFGRTPEKAVHKTKKVCPVSRLTVSRPRD
jgi:hypothetical protein